jgi:hypothetical protein
MNNFDEIMKKLDILDKELERLDVRIRVDNIIFSVIIIVILIMFWR